VINPATKIRFICALFALLPVGAGQAQPARTLHGHVPKAAAQLQPLGRLAAETNLYLPIGLPLRNQSSLSNVIANLYDPASPNFRQWLTAEQFAEQFGPTEADYQKVIQFAEKHGLKVAGKHSNRMVLDVTGSVAAVEKAFQTHLQVYRHPTENRTFYAPDVEPTVDSDVPILHVAGLDNYIVPRPLLKMRNDSTGSNGPIVAYATGSGPGGDFTGKDFRAAYAPGVTNTGAGQYIAIVDVGGAYYTNDIYLYESNAGLSTNIVVTNILLSGSTGIPVGTNQDDGEETLDIDMTLSMAPGATILNYEGNGDDVFNRIASDNLAKQITLSYGFGIDETIVQDFMEFVAQGQSFFQASGDGGADLPGGTGLTGMPYATIVGGTSLTTASGGGAWISETTWNGSGGGVSGYGMPNWQQGVSMSANLGSTVSRNYPDVAMVADVVIWWYFKNGQGSTVGGTSASSPQWAGFMALVNQTSVAQTGRTVGFLNPAIYTIGKGPFTAYTNAMHDITTGNNFNSKNPSRYAATTGYDLTTGWGSPRGSNTITALTAFGTNDFIVYPSQGSVTVVQGCVGTTVIQAAPMNGFSGAIAYTISGLPDGVSASFNPATVTTQGSILTLTVGSTAAIGTNNVTITATSGALTHALNVSLAVVPPIPGATQVSLAPYFNLAGVFTDGTTFGSGIDGVGAGFSANLIGPRPSLRNVPFTLGTANANNVITGTGQTITLPGGNYTTLELLMIAVNGNQANQTFTVTYTDNSTTVIAQNVSDWFTPQNYAGESTVDACLYRNNSNGTKDFRTFSLYEYTFTLDQTKTVKSITLPHNSNFKTLAMTLVNTPASASLAAFYNRPGMYTDGTSFTNPATGGIDGGGAAYSASLLGNSQIWNGVQFNLGPANVTNVVSCSNQLISLPAGSFRSLRMLATGVQGNQTLQSFTVTYTDTTTAVFSQNLSDWFTSQNYANESTAVIMGHRNNSGGTADNRTFHLYGYTFNLNPAKSVQSIRLPNNGNTIVLAISLAPDLPPAFIADPFIEPGVQAGTGYSGTIATNATDLNGLAMSFGKVSGPAWLNVAADGTLSGTPLSPDVGTGIFSVSVTDSGGLTNTATLNIGVTAAPSIVAAISPQDTNVLISWTGGIPSYTLQMNTDLTTSNWVTAAAAITSNSFLITPTNDAAYYRVMGQ